MYRAWRIGAGYAGMQATLSGCWCSDEGTDGSLNGTIVADAWLARETRVAHMGL